MSDQLTSTGIQCQLLMLLPCCQVAKTFRVVCASEMRRTHLVDPIFLVPCGQIWSRWSFPISDLGTHCPRIVDQLVWSKWRWKSKWVLDKPISQALPVGGREGWSINWLPSTLWMPIRQHSLSLTLAFSDWDSLYHALESHAWFSYQTSVSSRRALDVNNWRNVIFLQFGDDSI